MVRLVRNGLPLQDEILIRPQTRNQMHEAVAVANALKRWIAEDARQCLQAVPRDVILTGRMTTDALRKKHLGIGGKSFPLVDKNDREGRKLPERCVSSLLPNAREPYWVLNPEAQGDIRYVVPTNRAKLRELVGFINRAAQDPRSAIYGIAITSGGEDINDKL